MQLDLRMERSTYMKTFLLLVSIAAAHCADRFVTEGETINVHFSEWVQEREMDYSVLHRIYEGGDLLLANCSQPQNPPPEGYSVTCDPGSRMRYTFRINSTSLSGRYRLEGWKSGNISLRSDFQLIICAQKIDQPLNRYPVPVSSEKVSGVSSVELCRLNVTLGNGVNLRVYRSHRWYYRVSVVMDTGSSPEPLVEDLKGRLQVDLNSSLVTLHDMSDEEFYCTIWREDQCLSYSMAANGSYSKHVFTHVGKSVSLPCISKSKDLPNRRWWTPNYGVISNTRPEEEMMYMLNGSQSGNYSLIIPTVSNQHAGVYIFQSSFSQPPIANIVLAVCPQSLPLDVMFSHGESVSMPSTLNATESQVYWYGKKDVESEEELLYSSSGFVQMPGWLRGRVDVNKHNYTLTISNLTAEDIAVVFTWRRFRLRAVCTEASIRLVSRDQLGASSPSYYWVYGLLLAIVLLGLVAAVVWVKKRSGKRELTPGPESRERQQSGDEYL